jgi:phosphate/phosphite/phosphonate ABC transporter binding protein
LANGSIEPGASAASMPRQRAFLLLAALAACSSRPAPPPPEARHEAPANAAETLTLLVLPVERVEVMYERFLPLKHHLEKALGANVVIRVARDHESALEEIGRGDVQVAFLDPAAYCEVRAKYRAEVAPLASAVGRDGRGSRSVLVAKAGSGIERAVDAAGKRLALGTRQSAFSYVMPLAVLDDLGLKPRDFASVDLLEQEDRVALSVLVGAHDVGGLSEAVAKKYAADGLRVLKGSEAVSRYVICGSRSLARELRTRLLAALEELRDPAVLSSIDPDIGAFVAAEDRDFDMVRVMIRNVTGEDHIEYGPRTVRVAVLPLYSPITMYDRYDPLMRHLSREVGREFKLVIPRDFEDFVRLVKAGTVHFAYQNPYVYARLAARVPMRALVTTVSASERDAADAFRGVIITRDDSPIREVRALAGKKVLIVSRLSAGGYLSQRLFLEQEGIDVDRDLLLEEAKRQESVILGVYRGEAAAGFVREAALEELKDEIDMRRIRVLARATSLPQWPLAVRGKVDPALAGSVKRILLGLAGSDLLRAAKIERFRAARPREFELPGAR